MILRDGNAEKKIIVGICKLDPKVALKLFCLSIIKAFVTLHFRVLQP